MGNEWLLSFALPSTDKDFNGSIWDNLQEVINQVVKRDGIKEDSILPGELEGDVFLDAVSDIYTDVSEFYAWWFNPDDDRSVFIAHQKLVQIPGFIKDAVNPVVLDNLDAMREVGEIPLGSDNDSLGDVITDGLSRYIVNWQSWYYDRKRDQAIDDYFELKSVYEDTYLDGDYGGLNNILDDGQYDGISDIPYLSKELNLDRDF